MRRQPFFTVSQYVQLCFHEPLKMLNKHHLSDGVIQLFSSVILSLEPEAFDLFMMFRIVEGDKIACSLLQAEMKSVKGCTFCKVTFVHHIEALKHFFDLEHAYQVSVNV